MKKERKRELEFMEKEREKERWSLMEATEGLMKKERKKWWRLMRDDCAA
ncbi:hypothetical protein Patl1_37289 [Pistacia atlantica]|nr:hypothetical protein Patl1_37289 [Pistacia atlantica]